MPKGTPKRYTTISCDIERILDRSVKIFSETTGREHFIPLTCIEDPDSLEEEADTNLSIELWLAQKEGLDE